MRDFKEEMDVVVNALQMAELTLRALPDNSLDELEKVVQSADDIAFAMVPPMELNATTKRLEDQKKVLEWARGTILAYKSIMKEKN